MSDQEILLFFFGLNSLLIIGDASLGYFVLPLLLRPEADTPVGEAAGVGGMRRLLTGVVTLSMLVNCYAFFQQYATLLYTVTALAVLDIMGQLVVRLRRLRQD